MRLVGNRHEEGASHLARLSLRQRFLVGPLLGVVLLGALTGAFIYELGHQNALLRRVVDHDIAVYDGHSKLLVDLSAQHMALLDLLHAAPQLDEEVLYRAGRERLESIHTVVQRIEQTLPATAAAERLDDADLAARRGRLLESTLGYRNAATSAVTMATINLAPAPGQIAALNQKFAAMNRAFVSFLQAEHTEIRSEVAAGIRYGEASGTVIAVSGMSAALLLVALSLILSRVLSHALDEQITALTELGSRAGAHVAVEASNEIDRIAQAIAVFRRSLARSRDSERALSVTNQSLTEALEEVRRTRTELEQRVEERTRELQRTNAELSAEVNQRREAERALKQSEEQLQRLAFYDPLTRLPNRALFNDRLKIALAGAERHYGLLAVMYVDLDRFKDVNDTLGHAAGDSMLVEIGERFSRCVRAGDTLARTGGDEFTILLADPGSVAGVTQVAERIVEAAATPVRLGGKVVRIGASIGISLYPNHGRDGETLQINADVAMYEAKKAGRGRYRVFQRGTNGKGPQGQSAMAPRRVA